MNYSDDELEAIQEWEREGLEEYHEFSNDIPLRDFRFRSFVSYSKGRKNGRQIIRSIVKTIELFTRGNGKGRWTTKPPLDDWASEAYQRSYDVDGGYLSDKLEREIKQRNSYRF